MPDQNKKRRRLLGWWDAQDRMLRLNSIYRFAAFSSEGTRNAARKAHEDLDEVNTPEPDEELTDSELSDHERQQAIAREKWRREGRG
jgi:hypothetical protein